MNVSNFAIEHTTSTTTFSADIQFTRPFVLDKPQRNLISFVKSRLPHTHTIWLKVPTSDTTDNQFMEAFFCMTLVMALRMNEDLHFEGVVSQELLKKIDEIETFYRFEHDRRQVHVETQKGQQRPFKVDGASQFFTLGVDSFYTLLCNDPQKPKPTHLIFVDGFDIPLDKKTFTTAVHKNIQYVASKTNTKTIFIESNVRDVSDHIVNWPQFHVVALAAVGMLLPFETTYINGESFDWPDWGLRFGVDKLFSTSTKKFELVGHNLTRDVKVSRLQKSPQCDLFLKQVRVCWKNILQKNVPYNCSVCQKCIRTHLTFLALGIQKVPTFKPISLKALRELEIVGHVRYEWTVIYEMLLWNPKTDTKLLDAIEYVLRKPTRV